MKDYRIDIGAEAKKTDDTFEIYQLKDGEALRFHRFTSLEQLQQDNLAVDLANYALVYTAPLTAADTLDSLYQRFNTDIPADFRGHSLSVSDVIVLRQGGESTAHYVDRIGFQELPAFLGNERGAESDRTNIACARAIEKSITDSNYELYHYDLKSAARTVIAEYGSDRIAWVLANTVSRFEYDGRFSRSNKDWAKGFDIPDENGRNYIIQTHPYVLDGFIDHARREIAERTERKSSALAQLQAREKPAPQSGKTRKDAPNRDTGREV